METNQGSDAALHSGGRRKLRMVTSIGCRQARAFRMSPVRRCGLLLVMLVLSACGGDRAIFVRGTHQILVEDHSGGGAFSPVRITNWVINVADDDRRRVVGLFLNGAELKVLKAGVEYPENGLVSLEIEYLFRDRVNVLKYAGPISERD